MNKMIKKAISGAMAVTLLAGAAFAAPVFNKGFISVCTAAVKQTYISDAKSVEAIPYCAHVQTYGWQPFKLTNAGNTFQWALAFDRFDMFKPAGTEREAKRLEAIIIGDPDLSYSVRYAASHADSGWKMGVSSDCFFNNAIPYNSAYNVAGTTGQARAVEAVRIFCNDPDYDIYYRVHIQGKGWLNWTKNGEYAGNGYGARLEAIEIKKVNHGSCCYEDKYSCSYYETGAELFQYPPKKD